MSNLTHYDYDCPNCKGKKVQGLMDYLGDTEKAAGRLKEGTFMHVSSEPLSVNVERKPGEKVSVGIVYDDICLGCGQHYVKRIVIKETIVPAPAGSSGIIVPKLFPGMEKPRSN
jgi:hypothetical protein